MAFGSLFRRGDRTRLSYNNSFLPDVIIEQILLKLACTKSIVTCTSVCKSWYALIKSPLFIKLHLSSPNPSKNEYFLCSYFVNPRYSIDCYDGERLRKYCDLKFPHEETIQIIGVCNGLICYTEYTDGPWSKIYLWNPSIRKLKVLPRSIYRIEFVVYGFWFDADADDYKVVKVSTTRKFVVEVYSLSTNSWNIITTADPDLFYPDNIVHVNGTLYWLDHQRRGSKIMSLNTKTGLFRETLIWPAEKGRLYFVMLTSEVQSNCLFVLRFESYAKQYLRGVRVYDESLSELHRIDREEIVREPRLIGIRNNTGEVLFQNDQQILVCNLEDLKFKVFCPSSARTFFKVLPFTETLVLLNDGDSTSSMAKYIRRAIRKARRAISGVFHAL